MRRFPLARLRLPRTARQLAPRIVFGAILAGSAIFAAACGDEGHSGDAEVGGSDSPAGAPTRTILAHTPQGQVAIPVQGGQHHRSRCGACHTPEDRNNPRWKEVASEFAHDVSGMLDERTNCTCCHLGEVKGFGEPFEARCLDCHDDIQVTIPKMGQQHCVSCHTLGAGDAGDMRNRAWECQKCHAQNQNQTAAIDVHGSEDCANCHRPHSEPWTEPRDCTECHQAQENVHHPKSESSTDSLSCNDCHAPHETAGQAAGKCADCHKTRTPEIVATALFKGHDACTNCHAPHEFEKDKAKECSSCHQKKTMSGKGEATHAECQSCHSPHDPKGSAAGSCTKCHDKVKSEHPDPKGSGCTTCHNPHPGGSENGTATVLAAAGCASCHQGARTQQSGHEQVACSKCHEKHKEGKVVASCPDCHSQELAKTAQNPKHATCTGCHTGNAHRPTTNTGACSACHVDEQKTAAPGHQDCTKCHDSHSGKRLPIAAGCKGCHATEAASATALGHDDCNNCHRPHGPNGPAAPPTCTTCHQVAKLTGLHQDKGHQTCNSCHASPHVGPKSDRATCVGCHANEKDHQPDATVCSGCHRFKGQ